LFFLRYTEAAQINEQKMNFGTWIYTKINGEFVGEDEFGNRYFRAKKLKNEHVGRGSETERRWVIYKGSPEPSKVPAYWHGWLHYITDKTPGSASSKRRYKWEKEHLPNLTGTDFAYRPPGHISKGGRRDKATGDYESWKPE